MYFATFSIVARDNRTDDYGVGSCTAAPCVGAFLPFAQEGVGAIATQAWVNVNLGYQGLELMRSGLSVKSALEALLAEDAGRARRQVIGIDKDSVFGYTGEECSGAKGHLLHRDFAVAGNILASMGVLDAMVLTWKKSKGDLAHRILSALEAGQAAGGDSRGKMSAALLVSSSKPRLYHNLRVDMHDDPIGELRRVFDRCEKLQTEYGDDDGEVLRLRPRTARR
ncbi:MAG: DUF1028 domain-containing protein [Thermoplasmata archaeon]|jgi:uncharacterized Ntn-hydrolase superfamily protein|nr:DUF1028 domain-containing protein [Thermoplasmata archaeon]